MLFNRLFSLVALASLAAPIFAAPLPLPKETEFEVSALGWEVELELKCKERKLEIEVEKEKENGDKKEDEVELEFELNGELVKYLCPNHKRRDATDRSMAASVLSAQNALDALKPNIEEAMRGPIGSIEKKVGTLMVQVHEIVSTLNGQIKLLIGADQSVVYGNPSGGAQYTDTELAKIVSTYLLHISQIEDSVKHVSGYKFTSAQQRIREDLLFMKKTLATISPEVLSGAANMMAKILSMGHDVMA
ncbi:hypothetical protein RSOLAG1IB_07711 [Rhizoctonia solani AG-1 IB]|uniref:Uncharacterized protein n=1 Tax=Thanatephorus cucumeris (strain AG1-IB / isolate 7/3/14) TaxID=1108050 RepID=M5C2T8_THACB|nr:hypothetical protein BN14_07817 [Rhizoctonia solani AG-1 IB]CEL56295.1 hypothetical protein RSOLAG1IB_07711 [Rhizoctonia solani AG-1 IB]